MGLDDLKLNRLGIRLYTLNGNGQHFAKHAGKWVTLCGEEVVTHQSGRPGWILEACRSDEGRVRCQVCNEAVSKLISGTTPAH
jgi:hypothetical protein